jgi:phospholipase A1
MNSLCLRNAVLAGCGALALWAAPVPALAAPSDCHAIDAASERLACYDRESGRGTRAPTAPAKRTDPAAAEPHALAREVTPAPALSILDRSWGFDPASNRYDVGFHRSNYLLFGRYSDDVNVDPFIPLFEAAGRDPDLKSTEAKFQFSFKGRLWTTDDRRWGVWAAYTQQSQWQLYNGDESRPFRDTNYMPEIMVAYRPGIELPLGFRWNMVNVGFNHQSNGRSDILSRSWNRLIAEGAIERGDLVLNAKLWYRLKEDDIDDDNPDITDYLGYGEIGALYRWQGHSFSANLRGNPATGKGALQVGWFSPPLLGPLRFYVQGFTGYGESLIDYNWNQTTIGAGVALSDGL